MLLSKKTDNIRNMELENKLERFGITGKQAKIYLAVLELGTAKAFAVAKKAGVARPTAYDLLNKLVQDGLVSFFDKGGVRYYRAEDPERIRDHLLDSERAFERLLPELHSIWNATAAKPAIRFYEGLNGIKGVLEDTLTARDKRISGILSVVDLFDVPGKEFMETYVARRVEAGIRLRVVRSRPKEVGKEYWPTDRGALRELRYAPAPMVFSMTTYVYDDKVSLISSQKENFGMIIESREFHQNMNHLFDGLWQVSAPDTERNHPQISRKA